MLIEASQASSAITPDVLAASLTRIASQNSSGPASAIAPPAQTRAIASVTSGPATATLNSVPGESVSRVIRATPPKNQSVMSEIGIPFRIATNACPSSCRRIEAKKASALATPSRYGSIAPSSTSRTSR